MEFLPKVCYPDGFAESIAKTRTTDRKQAKTTAALTDEEAFYQKVLDEYDWERRSEIPNYSTQPGVALGKIQQILQ